MTNMKAWVDGVKNARAQGQVKVMIGRRARDPGVLRRNRGRRLRPRRAASASDLAKKLIGLKPFQRLYQAGFPLDSRLFYLRGGGGRLSDGKGSDSTMCVPRPGAGSIRSRPRAIRRVRDAEQTEPVTGMGRLERFETDPFTPVAHIQFDGIGLGRRRREARGAPACLATFNRSSRAAVKSKTAMGSGRGRSSGGARMATDRPYRSCMSPQPVKRGDKLLLERHRGARFFRQRTRDDQRFLQGIPQPGEDAAFPAGGAGGQGMGLQTGSDQDLLESSCSRSANRRRSRCSATVSLRGQLRELAGARA